MYKKQSAKVALNVLFSSETLLLVDLSIVCLPGFEKLNRVPAEVAYRRL